MVWIDEERRRPAGPWPLSKRLAGDPDGGRGRQGRRGEMYQYPERAEATWMEGRGTDRTGRVPGVGADPGTSSTRSRTGSAQRCTPPQRARRRVAPTCEEPNATS